MSNANSKLSLAVIDTARPKLSKPGKMPCKSWSLQAIETCPGSRGADGELVPACRGCYATTGNYRFKNVRAVREHNKEDWQRADWVQAMVSLIGSDEYFRWFDSGDCYHVKLARKMLEVMRATPGTRHWFPTRMHKFAKFRPILQEMEGLPNVVVRYSSDDIFGGLVAGANTSTIVPDPDHVPTGATMCDAYQRAGQCGDCRACWSKDTAVIAYPQHGQNMAKVSRQLAA
jgi:hypothetical protein